MPFYRGGRRSYGRRRRYGRRRPPTSAAVPRTTFAPRHQYLKLRTSFTVTSDDTVNLPINMWYNLENPSAPHGGLLTGSQVFTYSPNTVPELACLGYAEYGNIFRRYLVHGVKFRAHCQLTNVASSNPSNGSVMLTFVPRIDNLPISLQSTSIPRLPLAASVVTTFQRPAVFQRYYSLSKIQGRSVKLFDQYYHDWTLPTASAAGTSLMLYTERIETNTRLDLRITMTFYISALDVKSDISAAAAALVQQLAEPGPGPEPVRDPEHAEFMNASDTGVPMTKHSLQKLGVTRRRD